MAVTATNSTYSLSFEIPKTYPEALITGKLRDVLTEPGDDANVEGNGKTYKITLESHHPTRDLDGMKARFLLALGEGT